MARDHLEVADAMRASDAERDRVIRDLTRHCGDGRLTLDELEERIAEAYAATTRPELDHALRELPKEPRRSGPPVRVKSAEAMVSRPSGAVARRRGADVALRAHVYTYVSVMAFLTVIWFLTSPFGYFWPIWPALGWGLPIALHAGVHKARREG